MNPPPLLVLLSDLFYKIYPAAIIAAIAALGVAVLFRTYPRFAVAVSIGALVLLLEPAAFLCRMIVPLIVDFDSESPAAFLAFVVTVALPVSLPISALCLARRRQYAIS